MSLFSGGCPFLEKYAQKVPDASHLKQLIPIVQAQELERVKKALQGRSISIIFDGTTRVCEDFAVVARYIDKKEQHSSNVGGYVND